eukprot:Pgem_evm1s19622
MKFSIAFVSLSIFGVQAIPTSDNSAQNCPQEIGIKIKGDLINYYWIDDAANIDACITLCQENKNCKGYSFNTKSNGRVCDLFSSIDEKVKATPYISGNRCYTGSNGGDDHNSVDYPEYAVCTVTESQTCDYDYLKQNLPVGKKSWIVFPGGNTKCVDGSPFGFQVFPGKTDKLMLWFQGGGACYDYQTCVKSPTALLNFAPNSGGLFNYNLDRNPLSSGGWASVVNNYCSGDMFIGDSTRELSNGTHTQTVYFNGFNNTMSVLDWIKTQPEFPPEQEIVSGGCSAGSLGVQVWADFIVKNNGVDKLTPDSYIGYLPPAAGATMQQWNACSSAKKVNLAPEFVELCEAGGLHEMPPIFRSFLNNNPGIPVAYTGSAHDMVQRGYYALLDSPDYTRKEFVLGFVKVSATFSDYSWNALESYGEIDDNFSKYIVDTTQHCFLNKDSIVTSDDVNSPYTNLTMWEYIADFINNDVYDASPDYPRNFPPRLAVDINPANFIEYVEKLNNKGGGKTN